MNEYIYFRDTRVYFGYIIKTLKRNTVYVIPNTTYVMGSSNIGIFPMKGQSDMSMLFAYNASENT